jgi:hypothetical protein
MHQCQYTQIHQTYYEVPKSIYKLQYSGSKRLSHLITKQKIIKEILEQNHTIGQMDLADVYKIFHTTSTQYTFFSAAHGTFSKIHHILGHKTSLSIYEKIENRNSTMYSIWSQCIKTRTQQQKNQQKICKQLEAEQHIAQWPMGHWWNKRRN